MTGADMSIDSSSEYQSAKAALTAFPEHLAKILEGALASFNDENNPLRLHNTGNALRELLREFLDGLAPDAEIKKCGWFTPDSTAKTGVTRRHRVHFAIYRYLDQKHFKKFLTDQVADIADDLAIAAKGLSKLTHVSKETLTPDPNTVIELFRSSLTLFARLVDAIAAARSHVNDELEASLSESLADLFVSDFFDDLDELSTHTRPQDADGISVEITSIAEDGIHFSGSGQVYCDMQFGSDGDCSRGDGLEWEDSFPFTFSGTSPLSDPFRPKVGVSDIAIDTSSYHDDQ